MKKYKIGFFLIFLVLLPIIFYAVYEISSFSQSEQFIDEIYQQQMNTVLYSMNKSAWDICNDWARKIGILLDQHPAPDNSDWSNMLDQSGALRMVIISDTLLDRNKSDTFFASAFSSVKKTNDIFDIIKNQKPLIQKLLDRYRQGYNKIEAISFKPDTNPKSEILIFLSLYPEQRHSFRIIIMNVDINKFISNILQPILLDASRDEFITAIFRDGDSSPLYSTSAIVDREILITKRIWVFPNHDLSISIKDNTIKDLANDRFLRSITLIFLLAIFLVLGAVFLYHTIKDEMHIAQMKSEFVSNVSHELRTPLSLIRMFAETIELNRYDSEKEKNEFCQIIEKESERLSHIINNFLDISRIETGRKEYMFQDVELNTLISDVLSVYRFHIENRGFILNIDLFQKELVIKGDRESLNEVMFNLLDNAIKYSIDNKQITIRTGIENNSAYLEVCDLGIGIAADVIDHIFDKFYRGPQEMVQVSRGSGLGLALVKNIVTDHGGTISVISQPGKGSCFRIDFNII